MSLFSSSLCAVLQSIAISGGTIHPMDGTSPYVGTVVISDGVIAECGADIEAPDAAQVIEAEGLHVVPGLIDGMMHHDGDHDDLYVQAGVVLCRDMGNDLGRILFSKARSLRAGSRGPRLHISGAVLDGVPPATTKAVIVRSAAEAEEKIERLIGLGVDFIATHGRVNADALRGAAASAHSTGKTIWGPVPNGLSLGEASSCGLDGVVGLDGFLGDSLGWAGSAEPDFEPQIRSVLDAGVMVMPVVSSMAARVNVPAEPEEALSLLSPHYAAQWNAELESRERFGGEDYYRHGSLALARQERLTVELFGAGVHLVPGSGSPNPWVLPGDGLHEELASWVRAGIPAGEALRLATSGAAQALGISESFGEIKPGLYGDLLVVENDPRMDISTLRRPSWVVLRGEVLGRQLLQDRVDELRSRQIAATAAASLPLEVSAPDTPAGATVLSGLIASEAYGARVSVERYAVVELAEEDGTAYCSRMVIPASATTPASEVTFQQVIHKRKVTSFSLKIQTQGSSLEVNGTQVGGQLRVERRVDGIFFDNNSSTASIGVIDSGSAVSLMAIAHTRQAGEFKAIYFEDLDPIVADWTYDVKDSGIHSFQTGEGPMVALFDQYGALDKMERARGNGVIRHSAIETHLHGGPGLPLEAPKDLKLEPAPESPRAEGGEEPAAGD